MHKQSLALAVAAARIYAIAQLITACAAKRRRQGNVAAEDHYSPLPNQKPVHAAAVTATDALNQVAMHVPAEQIRLNCVSGRVDAVAIHGLVRVILC